MASVLVVLSSSPVSPGGRRALLLAESLSRQGHALILCCLQDAVLLGSDRAPREARASLDRLLARGARCAVLQDDLTLRGLALAPRSSGLTTTSYREIVDALADGHDRVIGCL